MKKKAKLLFETTNLKKLDERQKAQLSLSSEEKRRARALATREVYAKNILFDYSYKYFYEDGYGKESLILNLKDDDYNQEDIARQYFTACLLSFYQQQFLWETNREKLTDWGCTEFCVNGLMAGNRRTSRSGYDRKYKESSAQRPH